MAGPTLLMLSIWAALLVASQDKVLYLRHQREEIELLMHFLGEEGYEDSLSSLVY
jgi:hypothetical protein